MQAYLMSRPERHLFAAKAENFVQFSCQDPLLHFKTSADAVFPRCFESTCNNGVKGWLWILKHRRTLDDIQCVFGDQILPSIQLRLVLNPAFCICDWNS
jgi:hypothetical protein